MLDTCDMAGAWYVDFDMASFQMKAKVDPQKALAAFESQIEIICGGEKWLIKDFIPFQYGKFSETSAVHKSVKRCADAQGLTNYWPSLAPSLGPTLGHSLAPRLKDKAKALNKANEKAKAKAKASVRQTPTAKILDDATTTKCS